MKEQTDFCAWPKQCPLQHVCKRNLDIWKGPMPKQRNYKPYVAPPDGVCPGFVDVKGR